MIPIEEFEKLSLKQDELREIRNEYASKQQEIQKQINDIEIQKYDVMQYVGKIILLKNDLGAVYHNYEYMIVDRVDRLYAGPRFYGKSISITYSNSYKIGNSIQMHERSEHYYFTWKDVDNIKVVEPLKVMKQINNLLNVFDYGEEMNKLKIKNA